MLHLPIFLFDIDGVLIQSHGYRKAFFNTVASYFEQFGLSWLTLDETVYHDFVHSPFTAEWDMAPITIAAFLDWYATINPRILPYSPLKNINNLPEVENGSCFSAELMKLIRLMAEVFGNQVRPVEAIYQDCVDRGRASFFPTLSQDAILGEILHDSLNPQTSQIFQRLETFLLGSSQFETTFEIAPEVYTKSALETEDVLLLSPRWQERIKTGINKEFYASVITARPNVPDQTQEKRVFSAMPEAESALKILGWDQGVIPVIGAGSINVFEARRNIPFNITLKPAALHALTGIFRAVGMDEEDAFDEADHVISQQSLSDLANLKLKSLFQVECPLEIFVFEDSVSGIVSSIEAVKYLNSAEIPATLFKAGIQTSEPKSDRLKAIGAEVFPDINQALTYVFKQKINPY